MNENVLDGLEISLSNKMIPSVKHTGGDLPAGAKTVDKHPNRRTLTKDEKEAIVVPDGCTIKLVSKYSDATKTGLEVVGPKTVKGLTELINKTWPPKTWDSDESIKKFRKENIDHGVHIYTIDIA